MQDTPIVAAEFEKFFEIFSQRGLPGNSLQTERYSLSTIEESYLWSLKVGVDKYDTYCNAGPHSHLRFISLLACHRAC